MTQIETTQETAAEMARDARDTLDNLFHYLDGEADLDPMMLDTYQSEVQDLINQLGCLVNLVKQL